MFLIQKYGPHIDPAKLLKVNVYNIFTQYMLVKAGSRWETYLYMNNIEASPFVSLHLTALCTLK